MAKRLAWLAAVDGDRPPLYIRRVEGVGGAVRRTSESGCPNIPHPKFGAIVPHDDEDAIRDQVILRRDDWTTESESGVVLAVTRIRARPRVAPGRVEYLPSHVPSRALVSASRSRGAAAHLRAIREERPPGRRAAADSALADPSTPPSPDAPSNTSMCTGVPARFLSTAYDVGAPTCQPSTGNMVPFLDARVAAINAYAYLDEGYDGAGAEGLATWAYGPEFRRPNIYSLPHIVIGVVENSTTSFPDPLHPAFVSSTGSPRVGFFIADATTIVPSSRFAWDIDTSGLASWIPPATGPHGTATAGVALGSIVDGQDFRIGVGDAADARSGVARRAYAVFSGTSLTETLAFLEGVVTDTRTVDVDGHDYTFPVVTRIEGIDILVQSQSGNTGAGSQGSPGNTNNCPTAEQARGVDAESIAITDALLTESVIYFKSAGNTHDASGVNSATLGCLVVPYEMSAPGASPAAIPVGALQTGITQALRTAGSSQGSAILQTLSSGTRLPDGRSYPMLVTGHWSCGAAYSSNTGGQYVQQYGAHGATSAAAPTVAGGAALFKHWYLDVHTADTANQPGRMISNVLNMADGVCFDAWTAGNRTAPPAVGWGLGRFVMRRFASGHMSGRWFRGTAAVTITEGDPFDTVWLAGEEDARVPHSVKRLVITLWWLEVNTGKGETKAPIEATLYRTVASAAEGAGPVMWKAANGECVIRFQYDCYDAFYDAPPTGSLCLLVGAHSVPKEVRNERRDGRTVYVSWYWESGPDLSLIDCGAAAADHCRPWLDPTVPSVLDARALQGPPPPNPHPCGRAVIDLPAGAAGRQLEAVEQLIKARCRASSGAAAPMGGER